MGEGVAVARLIPRNRVSGLKVSPVLIHLVPVSPMTLVTLLSDKKIALPCQHFDHLLSEDSAPTARYSHYTTNLLS